jgi:hypothetical protein
MKTKDTVNELFKAARTLDDFDGKCRAVLLDAVRHGMTLAADIVSKGKWGWDGDCGSEQAILTARDNLKDVRDEQPTPE